MATKRVAKDWPVIPGVQVDVNDRNLEINEKNLIAYLLAMKENNFSYSLVMTLFGTFENKSLCNPYDTFTVPNGAFVFKDLQGKEHSNKNEFKTTIGLWLYNVFFFRDDGLTPVIGYVNSTISEGPFSDINKKLSYALMEDFITTDQMRRYLDKCQTFMPFENILGPNHTEGVLTCTKEINKKKKELYVKYKEGIDKGDPETCTRMEKELLDFSKELLGDDPYFDTLESGGGGSFGNNFKNVYVMKGAIRDPDPNAKQAYHVALSNFSDGVSADEYSLIANSLAAGPYYRGKKTESGGYWEKLFESATQYVVLDEPGTDCGTDKYITVALDNKNVSDYMYSFIIQGNKLVELTSQNMNEYIGKTVKMRFSSMCKRIHGKGKICNACAGNAFYRIGIKNIGAACSQIASTFKVRCMKGFHDSTLKTVEIDVAKAFGLD